MYVCAICLYYACACASYICLIVRNSPSFFLNLRINPCYTRIRFHTYVYAYADMHMHTHVRPYTCTWTSTYTRTHTHIHKHTYIHT